MLRIRALDDTINIMQDGNIIDDDEHNKILVVNAAAAMVSPQDDERILSGPIAGMYHTKVICDVLAHTNERGILIKKPGNMTWYRGEHCIARSVNPQPPGKLLL